MTLLTTLSSAPAVVGGPLLDKNGFTIRNTTGFQIATQVLAFTAQNRGGFAMATRTLTFSIRNASRLMIATRTLAITVRKRIGFRIKGN